MITMIDAVTTAEVVERPTRLYHLQSSVLCDRQLYPSESEDQRLNDAANDVIGGDAVAHRIQNVTKANRRERLRRPTALYHHIGYQS